MAERELDPLAILASMGITAPALVARVTGGADTAIWRVEHNSISYALRVFRSEQSETCTVEQTAMAAAFAAGVPVPQVYARTVWHERPALLLSWCAGRTLLDTLPLHPGRIIALGRAFGRTQALMHRVTVPATLRPLPDEWQAWSEPTDPAWLAWAGPDEKALQAQIRALHPRADALLHLDYHPLNVMMVGTQVSCVLDWANACAGDPRADFARTVTIIRLSPLPEGEHRWIYVALRRSLEYGWRQGYKQATGSLTDMAAFYAWAGAVMMRDLAPRLNRPDTEWRQPHFDAMRRWTDYWKQRAGIAG